MIRSTNFRKFISFRNILFCVFTLILCGALLTNSTTLCSTVHRLIYESACMLTLKFKHTFLSELQKVMNSKVQCETHSILGHQIKKISQRLEIQYYKYEF